jgi:hypothetical protein
MEQKKVYIGNGKKKADNWLTSSICLSDIPAEHVFEYNGKKYLKVNINVKDAPDQYGKDVSISVDTYKPEAKSEEKGGQPEKDLLPF